MAIQEFIPKPYSMPFAEGKVTYRSPSNIALVKYWGKRTDQIPANPSISFTLDACATTSTLTFSRRKVNDGGFSFQIYLDGEPKPSFRPKITTFLHRISKFQPFLSEYDLKIETSNTFPHSSGIASSASGMSALALCLMEVERLLDPAMDQDFFLRKASFLARLGSGSACRSIQGPLVEWGRHPAIAQSSDFYGIVYPYAVHANFHNYHDTILLVDKGKKEVSSSVGHELMHNHPYAPQRFDQASKNLGALKSILATGHLDDFIKVVESEALALHAMMMTGDPYFILMRPNTLQIIQKIWAFRKASKTHVCFTLDAGANVHVLYPEAEKQEVYAFIKEQLLPYCEDHQHLCDRVGLGAKRLL